MRITAKSIFLGAALALSAAAVGTQQFNFQLVWQSAPEPGGLTRYVEPSNFCFAVYQATGTNIGAPMTNWPLGFVITNWDNGPVANGLQWHTSPPVAYPAGQYFFTLCPSNSNGQADFSAAAFNAPWPGLSANLHIKRGTN